MITRLLTQPLSVQAIGPVGIDDYHDETLGPAGPPVPVLGYLEQQASVENLDDRDTIISKWVAYLPASTQIGPLDRITFQGQVFEVDGQPERCFNPRAQAVSHLRARLLTVRG